MTRVSAAFARPAATGVAAAPIIAARSASARAAAGEVSATGPIVGPRLLAPQGRPGERERRVFERFGVSPESLRPPRGVRLRGARRSLRVFPFDADAAVLPDAITLSFSLPPGSYATVLLDEVLEGGVVSSDGPG